MAGFVHRLYVRATPDEVYAALTDAALTARFWSGLSFDTTWEPGAPMVWRMPEVAIDDPAPVVLEADAPRRLAVTRRTLTPEWAHASGSTRRRARAWPPRRARAPLYVEPPEGVARLTVTHSGPAGDGAAVAAVREGWPPILSSLTSLLESDEPLFEVRGVSRRPRPRAPKTTRCRAVRRGGAGSRAGRPR